MPKFTEGVMSDGAVVLRDGEPLEISAVVTLLNTGVRDFDVARYYRDLLISTVIATRLFELNGRLFVRTEDRGASEINAPHLLEPLWSILSAVEALAPPPSNDNVVQHHSV